MVIFLSSSFLNLTVCTPEMALTTVDFPWATWPMVPTLMVAWRLMTSGDRGVNVLTSCSHKDYYLTYSITLILINSIILVLLCQYFITAITSISSFLTSISISNINQSSFIHVQDPGNLVIPILINSNRKPNKNF